MQCQDDQIDMEQSIQALRKETQHLQRTVESDYMQYQCKLKAADDEIQALKKEVCQLNLPHSPADIHVEGTDEDMYSPAFYTHPYGYRMRLHIYPDGCGNRKGTHVSIFTCMMQGPFDDHLKWPFRGEITIQIANQAGDHDHVEKTIPYNDKTRDKLAGRVTGNERSDDWGYSQFLAHTALPYNAVKKTQYLKDNHLIVRVVKVTLKFLYT